MSFATAAAALLLSAVAATIPAGAQSECSVELTFDETAHLLNNGVDDTAGPFDVDLEAGTYTIVVVSTDDHDVQVGIAEQPEEQFYLVLDSGYRSPATNDVPADANTVTTVFTNQTIDASSSLVLEHVRQGNVNSVFPSSVCFIQESAATPDVAPAVDCNAANDGAPGDGAGDDAAEDVAAGDADADADAANAGDAEAAAAAGDDGADAVASEDCDTEEAVETVEESTCNAPGETADADAADVAAADADADADAANAGDADAAANAGDDGADAVASEDCDTEEESTCDACLLYTSPSPRDGLLSRMPSSA